MKRQRTAGFTCQEAASIVPTCTEQLLVSRGVGFAVPVNRARITEPAPRAVIGESGVVAITVCSGDFGHERCNYERGKSDVVKGFVVKDYHWRVAHNSDHG